MGKNLYVPNLLAVYRPHYRMRWSFEAEAAKPAPDRRKAAHTIPHWAPRPEAFGLLGWAVSLSALLQMLVFPAVLLCYQTDVSVIAVLVAIYTTVLASLGLVGSRAAMFGLAGKKFAALCFECLVCPPLAINLVRRLSLDMCKTADLVVVAQTLMAPQAWALARHRLALRIEDQMSLESDDSPRHAALQARLEGLLPQRSCTDEHL